MMMDMQKFGTIFIILFNMYEWRMEVELYNATFKCKYRIDLLLQQQILILHEWVELHKSYLFKPGVTKLQPATSVCLAPIVC